MTSIPKEQAKLNGHMNLQKENVPHVRTKATTIAQDGMVKRRHLSVVDNNEQVRKVSMDGEGKTGNSAKSEANKLVRKVEQINQPEKDKQSVQRKVGKGKISIACDKTNKCSEVGFPIELPSRLPDEVIDIDVGNEMLEYGAEIVAHLKGKEKHFLLPEDFLCQNSVTDTMRSVLVDWLIQVQHHLKFSQECLYLTITMLDALVADDIEASPACWTATLVHYSGYCKVEVVPVALAMLQEVFTAATDEDYKYQGAHTKYKSQSQHKRLVLQSHLAPKVIRKAGHNLGGSNF